MLHTSIGRLLLWRRRVDELALCRGHRGHRVTVAVAVAFARVTIRGQDKRMGGLSSLENTGVR